MNAARPGRLPARERRALIEEAGARLFADQGYAGTTIEEVAGAAGVTKPVVYRHFASKKDLHIALLAKHRDSLLAVLMEEARDSRPLGTRLKATLDAWFGYVESHPFAWALLFRDTTGDPEIQGFHRELQASARALTAQLITFDSELCASEDNAELLAEMIRSATTGLALWWLEHSEIPRSTLVETARSFLLHGLAPIRAGRQS